MDPRRARARRGRPSCHPSPAVSLPPSPRPPTSSWAAMRVRACGAVCPCASRPALHAGASVWMQYGRACVPLCALVCICVRACVYSWFVCSCGCLRLRTGAFGSLCVRQAQARERSYNGSIQAVRREALPNDVYLAQYDVCAQPELRPPAV